jgi:hypothetical protein
MIEKNLIKNSHNIDKFVDMFEETKGKKLEQEHTSFTMMNSNNRSHNATNYSNNSTSQGSGMNNNSNLGNSSQGVEKE